jgi:capsule polysaccharide export protein KpsE/RkpR
MVGRLQEDLAATRDQMAVKDAGIAELRTDIATLTAERDALQKELRWYGHTIAGGGPVSGYSVVAKEAEKRWYAVTAAIAADAAREG